MPCQTLGNASSITQFNEDAWPLFQYGIIWQLVPTTEMTSKKSHLLLNGTVGSDTWRSFASVNSSADMRILKQYEYFSLEKLNTEPTKATKLTKYIPIQMARPAVTSKCRQYHWIASTQPAPLTMPQWPWPSAPKDLRPQCFATYPAITAWPRWSWFQMLDNNDWISCTSLSRKYGQH